MLCVKNLYKFYGDKMVLNDINFTIKKGSCTAIIGESGSGKSTLARLILGLERADSGEILYENLSLTKWKNSGKNTLSVVFQDYNTSINPNFKVREILSEPFWGRKDDINFKEILNNVWLNETFLDRYSHELSGGQLQRICIARAIAIKPKILVLDEPLSSLDVSVGFEILKLLKDLKQRLDMSFIFITHDLESVAFLCDRVIVLRNGVIDDDINLKNIDKSSFSDYTKRLISSVIPINLKSNNV
ncbi:ABC transporter ATP-binding protein [Campylobacter sp. faydin G-24]|uniref:ABC transporter ATP-binding protein n=2 Tax=Campylobacter anatolicus TaxID=2829105 RepID=A0ABS5HK50_9BACT|nr:dipeptide/oligopeptide/nickel ABC transporter ATP-binding protein [Campylobacter anatolicus]MBR8464643.1 ABC transporter ATP-binding protein [Campylobacter anatolicus]